MARGLAKRNITAAPKHDDLPAVEESDAPATEDGVVEMPSEPEAEEIGHHYRKTPLPGDQITIQCIGCGNQRTKYVKDASTVSEAERKEMFDKNGSYNPPLCGFCYRARRRKQKAAA